MQFIVSQKEGLLKKLDPIKHNLKKCVFKAQTSPYREVIEAEGLLYFNGAKWWITHNNPHPFYNNKHDSCVLRDPINGGYITYNCRILIDKGDIFDISIARIETLIILDSEQNTIKASSISVPDIGYGKPENKNLTLLTKVQFIKVNQNE